MFPLMNIELPKIIQGGMGFGVSGWKLARTVSQLGQLGIVSGTALDAVLARHLQNGDPGGHVLRALKHFPFPNMAKRILDRYYVPGGIPDGKPYRAVHKHNLEGELAPQELCIVGNFVEVFLAKEGHDQPIGINYLEKIQIPHLPSIYGALLAGASVIIMGAGIPLAIPGILDALANHQSVEYPVNVIGLNGENETVTLPFNPAVFMEKATPAPLERPDFLPIVSSEALASILLRKAGGSIEGFIIEGSTAGGHNAAPRGKMTFNDRQEPVYGPRDQANLSAFRKFGLPFWLAGNYGSAEGLKYAIDEGATGIQAGTAFALCKESGLLPEVPARTDSGGPERQSRCLYRFAGFAHGISVQGGRSGGQPVRRKRLPKPAPHMRHRVPAAAVPPAGWKNRLSLSRRTDRCLSCQRRKQGRHRRSQVPLQCPCSQYRNAPATPRRLV